MAFLYISEYTALARIEGLGVAPFAQEPAVLDQAPVANAGATTQSAAFGSGTQFVRVHTDSVCSIVFGANPVATTANKRMAANTTEYFGVKPGQKLAVILNT